MPRHNRRREVEPLRSPAATASRRDDWGGETFVVRAIPGANAVKTYRCPGCDQLIPVGVPHLVAWPERDGEAADRRHWHRVCWDARERRRPT
jgi:hypothetical protein